ncbi:LPS translocon maturation chaperone LptM [Robbsia betulipollinis]|uniref:LPS translocon maturation chaperone LptM n=1 Tax=Robbsia betulipollinis TaxID=2981849 RepID=UPI003D7B7C0B
MRIVLDNILRIGLRRSAILAAFALAACGQRGPLYLPKVPPLPPPPVTATSGASGASDNTADTAAPASSPRAAPASTAQ